MAKRKLTFKVGVSYLNKRTGNVWKCSIDYHPWDRTKRLERKDRNGCIVSYHISKFDRSEFIIAR